MTVQPNDGAGVSTRLRPPRRSQPARWHARPVATALLRGLLVAVPLGIAVGVGLLVERVFLPDAVGLLGAVARVFVAVALSLAVLLALGRVTRRLAPLVLLLRLPLVFPDHAPSRLALALRSGSVRRLREWADSQGTEPDAQHQAEIVVSLLLALQAHDPRTRGHCERVRAFADLLGAELHLPPDEANLLRWGALLHDIGKLEVPARVLNKASAPDERELQILREHPSAGGRIAEPLASWFGAWSHAIDQHHEKYDGTGYPGGLVGDDIEWSGRIVSVADAFETMTAVRAYKSAMSVQDARHELVECARTHFDPRVVRGFLEISIGRLRWVVGPVALLAQLPLLGVVFRAGAAAGAITATAAPSALAGMAALVLSGFGPVADPGALGGAAAAGGPLGAGSGAFSIAAGLPSSMRAPVGVTTPGQPPGQPPDATAAAVDDVLDDGLDRANGTVDEAVATVDEAVATVERVVPSVTVPKVPVALPVTVPPVTIPTLP